MSSEPSYPSPSVTRPSATVIAFGVRVEGDFASQGDVVIEGEVHGNVSVSGMLTVGPQAKLKADMSAEKAVISGTVDGNVNVTAHLEVKSTARVTGDIQAETASVESGAILNGKVMVGVKAKAPAPSSENVSSEGVGRNRVNKNAEAKI